MAKTQKRKGRGRAPATPTTEVLERAPAAKGADSLVEPFTPNPPRRNVPLLATSIVLLVMWLAILAWLAMMA